MRWITPRCPEFWVAAMASRAESGVWAHAMVIATTEGSTDPTLWSAGEAARRLRAGDISAIELVTAYLRRLEGLGPLNAVAALRAEPALREAAAADQMTASGAVTGPLHGVPFTVKDIIATAGLRTAAGSRLLLNNVPSCDAPAVARMRRAGALLLGKSTCPEFGFGVTTSSTAFGLTRSPWGWDLSPGGSSGGESALLSGGGTCLGLGTDYGGSLRWPAHATGVCALRPTPGRVPATGQIPGLGGSAGEVGPVLADPYSPQGHLQVIGPMARSVADLELVLDVIEGPDGLDPLCVEAHRPRPTDSDIHEIPVAWCTDDGFTSARADITAVMETVADTLGRAGFHVRHQPAALAGGHQAYNALRRSDPLASLCAVVGTREAELTRPVQDALHQAVGEEPRSVSDVRQQAVAWRADFVKARRDTPILLAPVAPGPAVHHDAVELVGGRQVIDWELMAFCRAVSLAEAPVVVVRCGWSSDHLPVGVQIVGPPFREDLALGVGKVLEDLFGGYCPPPRDPDARR